MTRPQKQPKRPHRLQRPKGPTFPRLEDGLEEKKKMTAMIRREDEKAHWLQTMVRLPGDLHAPIKPTNRGEIALDLQGATSAGDAMGYIGSSKPCLCYLLACVSILILISISSRDHLARRHMQSYRCRRCWKWFNARHKVNEHQTENCTEKELPADEKFMDLDMEAQVERLCGSPPEDIWWTIFQLLIPATKEVDLAHLKTQYYPCQSLR